MRSATWRPGILRGVERPSADEGVLNAQHFRQEHTLQEEKSGLDCGVGGYDAVHVSQRRHPRRVLEELHGRGAQATSMLYSDAIELAVVQRDSDGRIRVGKIRCVEKLEWAEVIGESEAEVARWQFLVCPICTSPSHGLAPPATSSKRRPA